MGTWKFDDVSVADRQGFGKWSGWGLQRLFSPFRYFPNVSDLSKHWLPIVYHVHICWDMETPDKYWHDLWYLTYTHEKSNFPVMEKLTLWPRDAIRRQGAELTLVQVMACCLAAPSYYLNQCWLIISKVLWHSSEGIIIRRSEDTNQYIKIENYIFRIIFISSRGQGVNERKFNNTHLSASCMFGKVVEIRQAANLITTQSSAYVPFYITIYSQNSIRVLNKECFS